MKHAITLVVDASGSMAASKYETEQGIAHFIAEQAGEDAETTVTLIDFTTVSPLDSRMDYTVVYQDVPAAEVGHYRLKPRYATPLYDAVARMVVQTRAALKATPADRRPDLVTLLVATDGRENASMEHDAASVAELLANVQRPLKEGVRVCDQIYKRGWSVVYVGANQDAVAEGTRMGMHADSSLTYDTSRTEGTYALASAAVTRSRGGGGVSFTEKERRAAVGEDMGEDEDRWFES